jgi:guanylate kinase
MSTELISSTEPITSRAETGREMDTGNAANTDDGTAIPRGNPSGRTGRGLGGARLTVLAGPTAVGKGTVAADIRERYPDVWISVSATTRKARPGEVHGVHYLFVTDAEFDRMIADDELLEWAVVHKAARYGTPRQPVLDKLAEGRPALLEIDLQGARQVRETMPDAHFVFLAPPSWDELVRRLVGRGTETAEERERRLQTATLELAAEKEFDVTIVNASVREAADQLVKLIR